MSQMSRAGFPEPGRKLLIRSFSLGASREPGIFAGVSHALALSPGGHLSVEPDDQAEPQLNPGAAARLAEAAPPMKGLEYLNGAVLARSWDELEVHTLSRIARTAGGAAAYLKDCNPTWNAVGRVTFHLAENKRNPAYPFAFLATYTHRI